MRSSGSLLVVAVIVGAMAASPHAQPSDPAAAYPWLLAREGPVRRELAAALGTEAAAGLLPRVREVVAMYEAMARRHPTSGYSDNALWQGAMLAADAFRQFGQDADRRTARRLFGALRDRFPSSSLVSGIPDQLARLDAPRPAPVRAPAPAARPATARPVAAARPAGTGTPSTLTGIQRESLEDAVRVTLTLAHETPFASERLDNPARLSIDLENTRIVSALKDARLAFPDDVVRQIRVGSHEGDRTRVVLDLENPGRFGIYPLYNPYRLVIDLERREKAPAAVRVANTGDARPATPPASTAAEATRTPPATPAIAPAPPSTNDRGGFSISRQLGLGAARIVIDPGHGGHDPGARATGITEAELVLDVALKLEQLLLKQRGVEVILTRRTSTFIPLEERTAIANRAEADLFLSIHANASTNRNARGIETYYLNFAPNPEAEAIAARENAGSAQTMRNLPEIVRAIALNNKIDESRDFAGHVQKAMYAELRKVNRQARNLGVKQAPFQVLIGATMPSILAEVSFITNEQEGGLLKTDKYRTEIAEALLSGIMAYQESLKRAPAVAAR
jgi:N-acetylmuramoyl-L-alanine amidase